ncbi:unnamed protein product [Cladocopium goreaui]|uniref:Helicase ATP-binding domain-containing protein n=1 Tax=Cladocopium goreaui TaxID=2562237 RepID=A0A9P1CG11_9DINO|nr:unnamed protein product [Cladocopium goreaui]
MSAPAGAGKTFVAVQCACNKITKSSEGLVLFVAPSISLGLYFFQWLAQRCAKDLSLDNVLSRIVLMISPYESFLSLHDEGGRLKPRCLSESRMQFILAIVDESHDVFRSTEYHSFFDYKVEAEQCLLLSSKSQASGDECTFTGVTALNLTEIVRSSQRIVAASAAFQGSPDEKEGVASLCPAGPPLKSFLFESDRDTVDYEKYAEKTVAALWDLMGTYAGLSFHRRIALLVPKYFLQNFKQRMQDHLAHCFAGRNFALTSFQEALSVLPNREEKRTMAEVIIMDTVENCKGLEQLIIVCIGLDEKLGSQKANCKTRASIYQAITRAQLQAIVVNQRLQGGWFEFLGLVKFKEDIFDEFSAMAETDTQAAAQSISQAVPSGDAHRSELRPPLMRGQSEPSTHDELKAGGPAPAVKDSSVWDTEHNDIKLIHQLQFDPRKASSAASTGDMRSAAASQQGHLLLSGRRNKDEINEYMKAVKKQLEARNVPVFMVEATVGQSFADVTRIGLGRAKGIVTFCTSEYGAYTGMGYETFHELEYAHDHRLPLFPIRLCEQWPPAPQDNERGIYQNQLVFKNGLVYIDDRQMNKAQHVADQIAESVAHMSREAVLISLKDWNLGETTGEAPRSVVVQAVVRCLITRMSRWNMRAWAVAARQFGSLTCGSSEIGTGFITRLYKAAAAVAIDAKADEAAAKDCQDLRLLNSLSGLQDIHEAAEEGNVGAVRHFLRVDPESLKTTYGRFGRSLGAEVGSYEADPRLP